MILANASWLGLHWADWLVLFAYLVGVTAIGVWSSRKVKDLSDFFMGGRRFGKVFMMFFAFGAGTSSDQAIAVVAGTWRAGLAGIWWQFLWLPATPFYWITAPVMRRMRALTTADFFEHRFDTSTATLYSIYGIITSIVFMAGGLYSSGIMVNALTGGELDRISAQVNVTVPKMSWDTELKKVEVGTRQLQGYEFAILAMTVMFLIYGMAGGLGAAIITDFIQGILTISFSVLLLPFVFQKIGGFGHLHEQGHLKPGMFDLMASPEVAAILNQEPITLFYVLMLSLTALAGIVVQPHIMGVCGAGKTELEGRFGFTFGNFMKRFCTIAWTFTGLACIVWYLGENSPLKNSADPTQRATYETLVQRVSPEFADLSNGEQKRIGEIDKAFADGLFGDAAYRVLPAISPGLIGLLLAALLAAIMSSSDAQMIVSSGLFTENIYRRFLVRNRSQRHYLWTGRLASLIIVLFALILQATFTDVIDALKVVIKTPAAIGISLWFGIMWRGWTPLAVWVSTIASASTWAVVAFWPNLVQQIPQVDFLFKENGQMWDAWQMLSYLSAGVAAGLLVSLVTPRTPKDKLDRFFQLLHTPIKPGEVVEAPCTLPENPAAQLPKLFRFKDIELPRPSRIGILGFVGAWILVGLIVWLTKYLAAVL